VDVNLPVTHGELTGRKIPQIVRTAVRIAVFTGAGQSARCLFVRHPHKGLELPGGALEPLETPKEGAFRELREEAGLILDDSSAAVAGFIPVLDSRGGFWLDIVLSTRLPEESTMAAAPVKEFETCWLLNHQLDGTVSSPMHDILMTVWPDDAAVLRSPTASRGQKS
jgi:8-oxo-dGTP pyrophosphatase MutT (NUDIX family)